MPASSGLPATAPAGPPRLHPDQPSPPGGAQLSLPHEVAGQLLPQLDAAPQSRLTEGAVQQDLVRLADPKIVAEEAKMLLGVFLPRDLHAWLSRSEPPDQKAAANSAPYTTRYPQDVLLPEMKTPWPRKQTPPSVGLVYVTPKRERALPGARALRGTPSGAELARKWEND